MILPTKIFISVNKQNKYVQKLRNSSYEKFMRACI